MPQGSFRKSCKLLTQPGNHCCNCKSTIGQCTMWHDGLSVQAHAHLSLSSEQHCVPVSVLVSATDSADPRKSHHTCNDNCITLQSTLPLKSLAVPPNGHFKSARTKQQSHIPWMFHDFSANGRNLTCQLQDPAGCGFPAPSSACRHWGLGLTWGCCSLAEQS